MKRFTLDRRFVLQGLGTLAIPLPVLEIMFDSRVARGQTTPTPPRRYIVAFAGATTGPIEVIRPTKTGTGYDLTPPLLPLKDVQGAVSVVSGIKIPGKGAGGWGGDGALWHGSSLGPLTCGVSCTGKVGPGGHGVATPQGVTSDQIVADAIGSTKVRAFHVRAQPQVYRENDGTYGVISMSKDASGKLVGNEPYFSPVAAWTAIFSGSGGGGGGETAEAKALREQRKSILDATMAQADSLMTRLGASDKVRLSNHLEAIRDLEKRVSTSGGTGPVPDGGSGCAAPAKPPADPPVTNPGGVGYAGEAERSKLLTDLLYTALKCDITRVGTICYTFAQTFVNGTKLTGDASISSFGDAHGVGHFAPNEGKGKIVAWHVGEFAALVKKLQDTPEPGNDGAMTMLDRTALVLHFESGWNGGDPHTGENMIAMIAGGMKGNRPLKQGQHLVATGKHPASLTVTAMNNALSTAAGQSPVAALGEVQGSIDGLF